MVKAERIKVLGASWCCGATWPGLCPPNLCHGGLPPYLAHLSAEFREMELCPGLLVHLSDAWDFGFLLPEEQFLWMLFIWLVVQGRGGWLVWG